MGRPPFDTVWRRITQHVGSDFETVTGKPFRFTLHGDVLVPSRTEYNLSKANFGLAYSGVPCAGPGALDSRVRGPSYVWAILHDRRIRAGEW